MFIRGLCGASAAVLACAGAAHGQFSASFESPDYNGSAAGTIVTNQQAWYVPVAGSLDMNVYTYAGNALGLPANPTGGDQFVAGRSSGGTLLARAQHAFDFTTASRWTIAFDCAIGFNGTLPATANNGSFSTQPSATHRFFQTLTNFVDVNAGGPWKVQYGVVATGTGQAAAFQDPGPEWTGLDPQKWYRLSTTLDFNQNRILSISITDVATGITTTKDVSALPWWLGGGSAPTNARPTDFRLFTGGAIGQISAFDNVKVAAVCYPDCDGSGTLNVNDYICFQTKFALGDPYADCDGNGVRNVNDYICFQTNFALGCS